MHGCNAFAPVRPWRPLIARVRCRQRCRPSCEPLPPAFVAILCQAERHGLLQEIVPLHPPSWNPTPPPASPISLMPRAEPVGEGVLRANCKPLFPFASLCAPQQTSIFFRPVPRPRRQGPHSQGVARVMNPRGHSLSSLSSLCPAVIASSSQRKHNSTSRHMMELSKLLRPATLSIRTRETCSSARCSMAAGWAVQWRPVVLFSVAISWVLRPPVCSPSSPPKLPFAGPSRPLTSSFPGLCPHHHYTDVCPSIGRGRERGQLQSRLLRGDAAPY